MTQKEKMQSEETKAKVAEVIAFLASEESSGVNGESITVALGGIW